MLQLTEYTANNVPELSGIKVPLYPSGESKMKSALIAIVFTLVLVIITNVEGACTEPGKQGKTDQYVQDFRLRVTSVSVTRLEALTQ